MIGAKNGTKNGTKNGARLLSRLSALPLCALLACATAAPPKELIEARNAYARAEQGPAQRLVPAELHVAHESLVVAENSYKGDPKSQDAVDNAYVALRKAQRAEALGNAAAAMTEKERAEKDVGKTQEQLLTNADAKLKTTDEKLKNTEGALADERASLAQQKEATAAERAARLEAEKKASDAMDALSKSLAVKSDPRGTVITLSGGVLFATGQATILANAQAQLNQVADALKTQAERHFTVEGHTDNQGTDKINDDLSARRATAVRDYLVVRGVSANAISAQGFGSKRPIGANGNPEGRAMNRRVEIIVDKAVTASN
jgi:outer membrane protein OmpA-like peptidoglycan-associated protein